MEVDSEAMNSQQRQDFWTSLQEEWEKLAREDELEEHPWLTDFTSSTTQPFKVKFVYIVCHFAYNTYTSFPEYGLIIWT